MKIFIIVQYIVSRLLQFETYVDIYVSLNKKYKRVIDLYATVVIKRIN